MTFLLNSLSMTSTFPFDPSMNTSLVNIWFWCSGNDLILCWSMSIFFCVALYIRRSSYRTRLLHQIQTSFLQPYFEISYLFFLSDIWKRIMNMFFTNDIFQIFVWTRNNRSGRVQEVYHFSPQIRYNQILAFRLGVLGNFRLHILILKNIGFIFFSLYVILWVYFNRVILFR